MTLAHTGATTTAAQPPEVGRLETDRFCHDCGYNLHGQVVWREPNTNLLVCRCPECGRFHAVREGATAAQAWLRRLGLLLLALWMLISVGVVAGLVTAQVALNVGTFEELTNYVPSAPATQTTAPGSGRYAYPPNTTWTLQARTMSRGGWYFVALITATAVATGFALAGWMAVTMHHWRKGGYLLVVVLVTIGVGWLAWWAYRVNAPHLSRWFAQFALLFGLAHLVGGIAGTYGGRAFARLVVRLVLPPAIRQPLAFLWRVDGKPAPQIRPK